MKYSIKNLDETNKIASDFVTTLVPKPDKATIVGLYGNLGAGKTAFTQAISKTLGVTEHVVSPTFVIEKIYELTEQKFTHLIHIDAYRLENSEELLHLGWEEIIANPGNLIVIEWPERVSGIIPPHILVSIDTVSENEREIEISE
jgi:tRNA threonylcarbamoyladenosine biosynthesis protein TsaE